jgi:hypothetical protein
MGACKYEQENCENRLVHGLDRSGGFRPGILLSEVICAEHDKRSFWQKKGRIRANCGTVLEVGEL